VLEQYEVPAGIFEFAYLVRTVRNDN